MKTGDIVIRHKGSHKNMEVGDMDKIKNFHSPVNIDLEHYGNGHSGESLREVTNKQMIEYCKMYNIPYIEEYNYQIY